MTTFFTPRLALKSCDKRKVDGLNGSARVCRLDAGRRSCRHLDPNPAIALTWAESFLKFGFDTGPGIVGMAVTISTVKFCDIIHFCSVR